MALKYLTAGESHGMGLTAILEGMPSHVPIREKLINTELKRRQQGYGRGGRMKIESDKIKITSGVKQGKTLGSPIALWLENKDFKAKKPLLYPRPGHADLSGGLKYNQHDFRNILERASARETAIRVAIGAICREFLSAFKIQVTGHVINIGGVCLERKRPSFKTIQTKQEKSPCRCIDAKVTKQMIARIDEAKIKGDSVGGVFEVIVHGLPTGLGSPMHWDGKLDAKIAQSLLSIQAIKGVEFGTGFDLADEFGSKVHDEIYYNKSHKNFFHKTNHAGGFEGGMTTGEDIVVRAVMKPIATLKKPLSSINIKTKKTCPASVERADTCAVPAASVIAENVLCFDIANALLEKFGGDSLEETMRNYEGYLGQMRQY